MNDAWVGELAHSLRAAEATLSRFLPTASLAGLPHGEIVLTAELLNERLGPLLARELPEGVSFTGIACHADGVVLRFRARKFAAEMDASVQVRVEALDVSADRQEVVVAVASIDVTGVNLAGRLAALPTQAAARAAYPKFLTAALAKADVGCEQAGPNAFRLDLGTVPAVRAVGALRFLGQPLLAFGRLADFRHFDGGVALAAAVGFAPRPESVVRAGRSPASGGL